MNAINKNEVSMFKVGDKVVSKARDTISTIFEITAIHDGYMESFEYELNYGFWRLASPGEIAAGHRIDHFVDINDMVDCEILDHPEDYTSPNCKKFDERVK